MDATVITTSLPVLAHDLGHQAITLKLALTAYVVGLGVFIPICGWVADRFGARTVFRAAIGVFMAGSLLCAVSSSLLAFVAARFLQGIGGAMMVPVGRIVIFRSVSRSDLVTAISYLTIPSLLGPVIGPPLGGFITTYFHWRWIFIINVPISLLGIYLAGRFIENFRADGQQPLDVKGFILSAIGSALLMLGLSLIDGELLSVNLAAAMCVFGIIFFLLYLRHARTAPFPLLDLSLLRIPTFGASVLGGSLFRIGLGAIPFLLPLSLQIGLGMTAFHAGTITCASAFGAIFMKAIGGRVLRRYGFRSVLIWNALLAALALASYGLFTIDTPYLVMLAVVLLGGFFPSMQFTCLNSMAYADLNSADISRATSLASVVQQISLGLGITIGGLAIVFSSRLQGHTTVVAADFWPAFLVIALFSLASIPVARRLPLNAGSALTGHIAPAV